MRNSFFHASHITHHEDMMQQSKLEIAKKGAESRAENLPFSPLYRLSHLLDYIAILRPILLIPGWTMLFLGYYKGLGGESISLPLIGNIPIILHPHSGIIITFFLYSLLMGAVYILNQLSDSRTDEINGKLYLIAQGYMKKSNLKIQIGILLLVSVAIAILRFPPVYLGLILLSIIMGILYSVPPIRLKGRPILDLLANASGFGIVAFAVGWVSQTELSTRLILDCLPYFVCVSAAFINTTIPDIEGDTRNGDITTGAFLGIRKSCIISTILVGTVPFISWFLRDFISLTASVLSLPFFIYMTISSWNKLPSESWKAIALATKVSLFILSLLVAILIPFYFIVLISTILFVRLYYQIRFGISYP